ncbi:hypothetical protein HPP92_026763 [Vanilla planifolia]|uniref:alpha-1,2-Mannosidase n=1 Tax=Vanilla planifolia TaxID=51239 RepID=A0A835PEM3_VANPL|nr:hypothetical protein HPP92_026763 [Vanilla planifolia]
MSSKRLPYSTKDVEYDNAKFRYRSPLKVATRIFSTNGICYDYGRCSIGKFLMLLMIGGLTYLMIVHRSSNHLASTVALQNTTTWDIRDVKKHKIIGRLWKKPPRLPPQLSPDDIKNTSLLEWISRQKKVKEAFVHAWTGYRRYAMGYDELMPLSKRGIDGLGGLGATIVDSLDTAMIMGLDEIVYEQGVWIEKNLMERIRTKGQVNLFETTTRVLGGLLSAYHLSGNERGAMNTSGIYVNLKDGLSSTAEVSSLQLEFNYLSKLSNDPRYGLKAMKVLEHIKALPKVEGLVPIYTSPHTGQFNGENIRLGSRGDSYYEYLIKVWIQQENSRDNLLKYLYDMYIEAMKGVKHLLVRKSVPKGLVFVGELPHGSRGSFSPKMDHLVCFLPGTLALGATKGITKRKAAKLNLLTTEDLENLSLAEDLLKTCFEMYSVTSTGLAPEIAYFNVEGTSEQGLDGGNKSSEYINDIIIKHNDRHNLLRPETVESLFILYRITEDPKYREWGWQIFNSFEEHTRVDSGGYSSLDDVTQIPPHKRDKMETFFLGETLKYLYLLFGDKNILPLDKFVFNTEAHPFPVI